MGSEESSQEKTEEATPRKVRDARKKGQVAKSRDINSVLLILIIFGALALLKSQIAAKLHGFMVTCFSGINVLSRPGSGTGHEEMVLPLLHQAFQTIVLISAPLVIIAFVVALAVSFLQVGAVFSTEPVKLNWQKINPVQGFKNIFKLRSLIELIKSAVKISLVFVIAYFVVKKYLHDLLYSMTTGPIPTLIVAGKILSAFIIIVGVFFLVIGLFDLLYQNWQYHRDLRMTKYEVQQEFKRDEGDPLLKSQRRQLHQELTSSDMTRVAKSDVVVVNPIHLAIAIRYDRNYMAAPQMLVKGKGLIAEQIKRLAQENNVPIIENVPLAHSLIELDEGSEIPEDLYEAMAEILSFVYRLQKKTV